MTMQLERVLAWEFPVTEQRYDERDTILYSLGLGLGADPTDERELRFVYEDRLRAFPTMGCVLGHPGPWFSDPRTGIDWVAVLHGEQEMVIHRPLLPADTVTSRTRVTDVVDKGPGRGALVYWERTVSRTATGEALCTVSSTLFCRNDGGAGGSLSAPRTARPATPTGPPERVVDLRSEPRAALIYRLSGDRNPLHADPSVAREAGFERPVLHGLCTYGMAAHAILRTYLDYDPDLLTRLRVRFSAPVYPGETIRTELWPSESGVAFRCVSVERGVTVIDDGRAEWR